MDLSISKKVVSIWWGMVWRGGLIGLVIGFTFGFLWAVVGGSTKEPMFNFVLILTVWTYGSMLAIKKSLEAHGIGDKNDGNDAN